MCIFIFIFFLNKKSLEFSSYSKDHYEDGSLNMVHVKTFVLFFAFKISIQHTFKRISIICNILRTNIDSLLAKKTSTLESNQFNKLNKKQTSMWTSAQIVAKKSLF